MAVRHNELAEQDQITIALKKRAGRLLVKKKKQRNGLRKNQRSEYINTVRALEAHVAEKEHELGITDPYRSIYDFFLQEIDEWDLGSEGPTQAYKEEIGAVS